MTTVALTKRESWWRRRFYRLNKRYKQLEKYVEAVEAERDDALANYDYQWNSARRMAKWFFERWHWAYFETDAQTFEDGDGI